MMAIIGVRLSMSQCVIAKEIWNFKSEKQLMILNKHFPLSDLAISLPKCTQSSYKTHYLEGTALWISLWTCKKKFRCTSAKRPIYDTWQSPVDHYHPWSQWPSLYLTTTTLHYNGISKPHIQSCTLHDLPSSFPSQWQAFWYNIASQLQAPDDSVSFFTQSQEMSSCWGQCHVSFPYAP